MKSRSLEVLVPWVSMPCPFFPLTKDSVTIDATLTTPMMEGLPLKITTRHLFLPDLHHLLDPSRVWPISQSLAFLPLTTSFLAPPGECAVSNLPLVSYTLPPPSQANPSKVPMVTACPSFSLPILFWRTPVVFRIWYSSDSPSHLNDMLVLWKGFWLDPSQSLF